MKRTRKNMLSCFLVLLMVCTAFAFEPIPAKAATTYTVSTEAELATALTNAVDGDTIIVNGFMDIGDIRLTEPITIKKDITLVLNAQVTTAFNSVEEATIVVSNCEATIEGYNVINGCSINDSPNVAIMVRESSENTVLNLNNVSVSGRIDTYDDPATATTVTINMNEVDLTANPAFDVSGGDIIINTESNVFTSQNPEEYLGENIRLGENVTWVKTTYYDENMGGAIIEYDIRSTVMSPEFQEILTDGKLLVSTVTPSSDAEVMNFVNSELTTHQTEYAMFYVRPISDGLVDVTYDDGQGEQETHRIEVVYEYANFDGSKIVEEAQKLAASITQKNQYGYYEDINLTVADMEIINMWANGFNPNAETSKFLESMANYSSDLKTLVKNTNMDFKVVYVGGGGDWTFATEARGDSVISVNDVVCAAPGGNTLTVGKHVIYVSDDISENDYTALMSAAQDRINEYLGDDSKVVLSYGGTFASVKAPGIDDPNDIEHTYYKEEILRILDIDEPIHYFVANFNGYQAKLLIIPDESKMRTPTYKTVDMASNVTITSASSDIPLDTSIRASELTSGTTYEEIIDTLGVEENVTFDLKLYSHSISNYVSSLEDDVFEVSIPIPETFKDKTLMAYYVGDDGKITKYPAEVVKVGDKYYAVFETDHFSIYTIAEGVADVCDVNGASHKLTAVPAKAATTTAEGNKAYWTCDCGKWFADADGKTEITDKTSVVIPKLKDTTVTTTEDTTEDVADGSPATGDNTNIVLLFGMMLISMVAIFAKKKAD